MAEEITITTTLKVSNNEFDENWTNRNLKVTQAAIGADGVVQTIGFAAHEALTLVDVSTAGYAFFKNLEATGGNFVEVGVDVGATFYPFLKLKPGESAVLRMGTNTPYAKADTAAVKLQWRIMED